jgi:hypothetical protein
MPREFGTLWHTSKSRTISIRRVFRTGRLMGRQSADWLLGKARMPGACGGPRDRSANGIACLLNCVTLTVYKIDHTLWTQIQKCASKCFERIGRPSQTIFRTFLYNLDIFELSLSAV